VVDTYSMPRPKYIFSCVSSIPKPCPKLASNSESNALPDSSLVVDLSGLSPNNEGPTTSATEEASARRARENAARRADMSAGRMAVGWWGVGEDNV
jgi:hypothetical protein